MHWPGIHIGLSVLLCCSSLLHTSVLSWQLAALLSRLSHLECVCACVCVLVCAQPCSLQSKSQLLGILSACLRGSGVALAASQGSVSFSKRCLYVHPPYHSNTPPPPAQLVEAPLGMPSSLEAIRVRSQRYTFKSSVCASTVNF